MIDWKIDIFWDEVLEFSMDKKGNPDFTSVSIEVFRFYYWDETVKQIMDILDSIEIIYN